jgi:hypothetical protein
LERDVTPHSFDGSDVTLLSNRVGRVLTATLTLDPAFRIGPVHRRLFGSFVEHMGR